MKNPKKKRVVEVLPDGKLHLFSDGIPSEIQKTLDVEMADYKYYKETGLCPQCKKNKADTSRLCRKCYLADPLLKMAFDMTGMTEEEFFEE